MKFFFSFFIGLLPFNKVRCWLWSILNGITIENSHISNFNIILSNKGSIKNAKILWMNFIGAEEILINGATIKFLNIFKRLKKLTLGMNTIVLTQNSFQGTKVLSPYNQYEQFQAGENVIITKKHLFDCSDMIKIGNNVTIGGEGTQMWTHGFDLNHVKIQSPILLANDIYIGSRCILGLGISICNKVSIGSNTNVFKSIKEPGFYISSNLIRKGDIPDFNKKADKLNGYFFYRKKC